jgi:hypothetical protein
MNRRRPPLVQLLARLSLLLAAASYLTVAAVGPLAHLALFRTEQASTANAPGTPGKHAPAPPHDESHCLLCHSLESVAAPSSGMSIPLATLRFDPPLPETAALPSEGVRPLARARAPPLFA